MFVRYKALQRITSNYSCKFQCTWHQPNGYDTGIKIYNCVAKEKVPFIVKSKDYITWYTCGPTVYDSAHMGHASCYVKLDIIQRILRDYFNLNLVTAMNITDVDDKIIQKCQSLQKSYTDVTQAYEEEFWNNLQALQVSKPNIILKVSQHMNCIQNFVATLLNQQQAYVGNDNSIYFDTTKCISYGKLQNLNKDDTLNANTFVKRSTMDFALWKAVKAGEPFWKADFGDGRPGWHIECSALAAAVFGSSIDVHAGGIDLRFPHHENEETQSCAYYNVEQWVNYWIHTGHLQSKSEKMSKSLNNGVKINDFLLNNSPHIFRLACLLSNYRYSMEYSEEMLRNADNVFKTYKSFIHQCYAYISVGTKAQLDENILFSTLTKVMDSIDKALKDDFDTATVMKELHLLVTTTNKMLNSGTSIQSENNRNLNQIAALHSICNYIVKIFNTFGIELTNNSSTNTDYSHLINLLIDVRQRLREIGISNKDKNILSLCDSVRDELNKIGVTVTDHGKKTSWSL